MLILFQSSLLAIIGTVVSNIIELSMNKIGLALCIESAQMSGQSNQRSLPVMNIQRLHLYFEFLLLLIFSIPRSCELLSWLLLLLLLSMCDNLYQYWAPIAGPGTEITHCAVPLAFALSVPHRTVRIAINTSQAYVQNRSSRSVLFRVHSNLRFIRSEQLCKLFAKMGCIVLSGCIHTCYLVSFLWTEKFNNALCTHLLCLIELKSSRNNSRLINCWNMLVLLKFPHFSPERAETGSLGTTECEV